MIRALPIGVALALITTEAAADTRLVITLEEREIFGSNGAVYCKPSFTTEGASDVIEGIVSLGADGGPADLCWFRHRSSSREGPYCSADEDFAVPCAEVSSVTVQRLSCSAESGKETGCGAVTAVVEGSGTEATLGADALERSSVEIVVAPLVDETLFDKPWGCSIDTEARFTPRDDERRVTVSYAIDVGGRDGGSCNVELSSYTSSSSCGGGDNDYTCADISSIEVTDVACADGSGNTMDCGTVAVRVLGHEGR